MNIDEKSVVLIVAAHPDDEVLAMGGSIAKFKAAGATVVAKFIGEGVSARFDKHEIGSKEFQRQTHVRVEGAKSALKRLRVDEVIFGNQFCCRFDSIETLDLIKDIERSIGSFKPTHIFTHSHAEVNFDHQIVYKCVQTAVRPKPNQRLTGIYSFEIVCSGSWTFEQQFKPSTYVDITNYWQDKLDAWHCYEGESRPFPFPRSDEGLLTLARYRGMQSGVKFAEGFRVLRETF